MGGNPLTETYTDTNFSGIDNSNNYTGYTWDEVLDLYFAQNRFYDSADHRFTQEDPIKDGENWYAYCGNNPAITVDTYGLAATNVRYVYGDDVNFRKGPGKRFQSIAMLKRNTRVYYQNEKSWADSYNWAKVKYSKYTGWIADTYLSTGPHYFTTLSCRLIYQSARPKGVTADNKTAPDMTYNDYIFSQIAALHPYFEYQLKESADTLFHEFSSMATDFFATGKMNDVILDMIQHFRYGNGKPYSNSVLTQEVKNHSSTQNFINGVKDIIKNQLAFNGGNLGALDYTTLKNKIGNLTRPSFSTWYDRIHGLTITINDTWGNNVQVINYKVSGTKFSGTLRFNIYDHFGLDQPRAVPQRCHIDGISGKLLLAHNVHRYMGQIKIFQRDRTDVIIVRHLIGVRMGVAVLVRPCVGFCAIPGFHHHILRENVLAVKQHLQRSLYFVYCPLPLMERTQKRKQHIGVMFDFVQIEVVFVIVMGAFIGVQIMLQIIFQRTVGSFGGQHIPILTRIGAGP